MLPASSEARDVGRQTDGTHGLVADGEALFTVDHIRYAGRRPESREALVATWSQHSFK